MLTSSELQTGLDMSLCLIIWAEQAYLSSQGDDVTWLTLEKAVDGHMSFFWLSTSKIENDWSMSARSRK